ncbi:M56 family metallopeptidase [Pseudonocardia sp. Cha107L01]|uniref:M56 family metallopeptidase n=1 Tax=Pseudonocardia sp. Cha107L01 TaxID=3457576 RepID=UPI00403EB18B
MRVAVYLPLLVPVLAAVSARWLAGRLHPRVGTWLLTATAVGLALTSGLALTALAATAVGQIPLVGALGDWSVGVLHRDDPASLTLAMTACVLLVLALAAAGRALIRRTRALINAARTARRLPTEIPFGRVVVFDDPCPDAYALPGVPGRIVVSTGMLDALNTRERQVLLAHERAHLTCGHHVFVALAYLAAATNPLLRPVAAAVGYTTERWADEYAASAVGDRRLVARTIAKAALLTSRHHSPPAGALAITTGSAATKLRGAGPVPRRVAALLAAPPRRRRLLLALALTVLALAAACSIETVRDLDALFDLARIAAS